MRRECWSTGGARPPLHRHVSDLPDLLHEGDLVVVNDSRVIPARLAVRRATGGAAEVLLLEPLDAARREWEALVRPGAKVHPGARLYGADGVPLVEMIGRTPAGDTFHVRILGDGDPLDLLATHGEMPLPPYITTPLADAGRYQTVYANEPGSAAAPTAGLHLTPAVLGSLADRGIEVTRVELVVGLDTFQPISVADPLDHRIHSERYRVPERVLETLPRGSAGGRRRHDCGAGAGDRGHLRRSEGRTELYIHRGYEWKVVDVMMTNFHLPRTTLLLMIDAFVGPRWRALYDIALADGYRFLSFGDAMLLDRHGG